MRKLLHHAVLAYLPGHASSMMRTRHSSRFGGHGIVYIPGLAFPPSFPRHESRTFSTPFVTMTVVSVLLQATSLIASLSQLRTNGKLPCLPFQLICVFLAPRDAILTIQSPRWLQTRNLRSTQATIIPRKQVSGYVAPFHTCLRFLIFS